MQADQKMRVILVENQNGINCRGGIASYISILQKELLYLGVDCVLAGPANKSDQTVSKDFIRLSCRTKSNPYFFFCIFLNIRKIPNNPDVICHFHHPYMALPIQLFRKKTKTVLTLHGRQDLNFRKKRGRFGFTFYRMLCKWAISRYDFIISNNQQLLDYYYNSFKILQTKTQVIPVTADMNVFHPRDKAGCRLKYGISTKARIICFAGRIEPEKNIELLVEAFKIAVNKITNLQLLIIGEGSQRKQIEKEVYDQAIEGITFMNFVCSDDLAELLNVADVFALASLHEGGPMIVREALACNLPVVSTDVGDVKNLIGNLDGCYISDSNPIDFAASLCKALETEVIKPYRNHVENYSPALFAEKILYCYNLINNTSIPL
jgi:L-malate glycosyltransferase